jgi:hypothetical protein
MKKLLVLFVALMMLGIAPTEAQTKTKTEKTKTTKTVATKVTKDGKPDRRFKENKGIKKDGTPDMRYKANKPKK